MNLVTPAEHPFAQYVRILGKGKRGARNLTREEARDALGRILDGEVEEAQLGAFLMLLRYKEESAEEMAGFCEAVRSRLPMRPLAVDLDWPSYAGKKRHLPWYLLAAKCLADSGVRVLLHGAGAHTSGRIYTESLLEPLGIPIAMDWARADRLLAERRLAFFPLGEWMPALQRMIDMRAILGLRSPIHSLVRLINPGQAPVGLQSIFHPGYQEVHRDAAALLGDTSIVVKGEGGEIELNPDREAQLFGVDRGAPWEERWPALSAANHVKPERLDPQILLDTWSGAQEDDYGVLAVQGTLMLALRALGSDRDSADTRARELWAARRRTL